ncbi:MAG TPA: polysaccharide biosynthesis/export family protein [Magnetospirillum sp.]|nr:polysaccharide biosynthesis/export family protein [Magnetospirillum sp.]
MKFIVRFGLLCSIIGAAFAAQAQTPWDVMNADGTLQRSLSADSQKSSSSRMPSGGMPSAAGQSYGTTGATPPGIGYGNMSQNGGSSQFQQMQQMQQMQQLQMQQGRDLRATGGDIQLSPSVTPVDPTMLLDQSAQNKPFGWELFAGGGAIARARGMNPSYIISPGDNIALQVWGAEQPYNEIVTVDLQGNIFVPTVGPVRVAGLSNSGLNDALTKALSRIYTSHVRVYTNLLNTQPVGVYVTGAVYRPGRYAGEHTDSLLHYMAQAGGVDLRRGSFRDIAIMRRGQVIARADLYQFLLKGMLPQVDFQDNDTIVVGPQKATILVTGDVRNAYRFEIERRDESGESVLEMIQPLPKASHVALRGVRGGQPYNVYMSIDEFRRTAVHDGDAMVVQSDMVDETIFVSVTGQRSGPSSLAVPRGARLSQLLDMIAVDRNTADLSSIYIRRKSVADRQRRALEMALDQLQRAVLTTRSVSQTEAEIRVREAELVQKFVEKARAVEPEGRVVLAGGDRVQDMQLEAEDVIVIPQRSDVVIISGEVNLPQTLLFRKAAGISDYVDGSGGYTDRADTSKMLVMHLNGAVQSGSDVDIQPGDHIMVMPRADSKEFAIFKDIVEVMYRIAVSTGVVVRLL